MPEVVKTSVGIVRRSSWDSTSSALFEGSAWEEGGPAVVVRTGDSSPEGVGTRDAVAAVSSRSFLNS